MALVPGLVCTLFSLTNGYKAFFWAAMRSEVPIWIVLPGRMAELRPLVEAFPDLQFIVDHAGMPESWQRTGVNPVSCIR